MRAKPTTDFLSRYFRATKTGRESPKPETRRGTQTPTHSNSAHAGLGRWIVATEAHCLIFGEAEPVENPARHPLHRGAIHLITAVEAQSNVVDRLLDPVTLAGCGPHEHGGELRIARGQIPAGGPCHPVWLVPVSSAGEIGRQCPKALSAAGDSNHL
jgi:hypothetical protein